MFLAFLFVLGFGLSNPTTFSDQCYEKVDTQMSTVNLSKFQNSSAYTQYRYGLLVDCSKQK